MTINITARSGSSKWGNNNGNDNKGDGGGCETYDSFDRMNEMLKETQSGNWRIKLREAQEAKERQFHAMKMAANSSMYRSSGLTEEELQEKKRREAQKESEASITLTEDEKAALVAKTDSKMRKKRKKRRKLRDPNAPRGGDYAIDGTTAAAIIDGQDGDVEGDEDVDDDDNDSNTEERMHLTANRNQSGIAALLAQAGVDEGNWGSLLGANDKGDGGVGGRVLGGIMHDDENESSLIAMTEEEEMQLAYEQRIKAEHEEQRKRRQERREQIMKKNSLSFLEDPKEED